MRNGNGVVGISLASIGNPAVTFETVTPEEADGTGVGVIGASGDGAGVRGISQSGRGGEFRSVSRAGVRGTSSEGNGGEFRSSGGEGVSAKSDSGVAVHAVSRGDRGGVFESGRNVAQINLVPLSQTGERRPQLPKDGVVGDLLLIENTVSVSGNPISSTCSLWLCVSDPMSLVAQWREVQLGSTVAGTI
jgi:hypothetical protein